MSDAVLAACELATKVQAALRELDTEERTLLTRLSKVRDAIAALRNGNPGLLGGAPFAKGDIVVGTERCHDDEGTRFRVLNVEPHRGRKTGWAVQVEYESADEPPGRMAYKIKHRTAIGTDHFEAVARSEPHPLAPPLHLPPSLPKQIADQAEAAKARLEDARGTRPTMTPLLPQWEPASTSYQTVGEDRRPSACAAAVGPAERRPGSRATGRQQADDDVCVLNPVASATDREASRGQTLGLQTDRSLPVLVDGIGARDEDCLNYSGCFDRWAASTKKLLGWAHCPTGCIEHQPRVREEASVRIGSLCGGVNGL